MSSRIFLQSLQNKLKGGNTRSIHLNALPGRFATRLDLQQLNIIKDSLAQDFLRTLLTKPAFEFTISFDQMIDLNIVSEEVQKKLGLISKRLNSIIIENDDYFKEHGVKNLGFGYPLLIKRSSKDPSKVIKAPLFIWPLEAVKSKNKVNEWLILRNKVYQPYGKVTNADIHSVGINEVLLSLIKGEDGISLARFSEEMLEDAVIDKEELLNACASVLHALNSGSATDYKKIMAEKFESPVNALPDKTAAEAVANNNAYIHFGGIFGLFRAQKESIITDITKLMDRFDEFEFDNLVVENLSTTPFTAVNTDPSQQAIISTLGISANQIIQGPPGTGKSQSLTALITNALANGLKCLVVCEKKTALDVIKKNLERTNKQLAELVAIIDDVNDDREAIVDSVRERHSAPSYAPNLQHSNIQYDAIKKSLHEYATYINRQHQALDGPLYSGKKWGQLVGEYLRLQRKLGNMSLNNVLNIADFQFQKDEQELGALVAILKKAEVLFQASKHLHATFAPISEHLFTGAQTIGEVKHSIEAFIAFARKQTSLLEKSIQGQIDAGAAWITGTFQTFPISVQDAIRPYLNIIEGASLRNEPLPAPFNLEKAIDDALVDLKKLLLDARKLKEQYHEGLELHYDTYGRTVKSNIAEYLAFVNVNLAQFGNTFFRNDRAARFKTNLFGLVSDRHRRLRSNRLELVNRISNVRKAHLQQTYIEHYYIEDAAAEDLSLFVNNVRELYSKVEDWSKSYPDKITAYLGKMNEHHFHPGFDDLRSKARHTIQQFNTLLDTLDTKYKLISIPPVLDINSLTEQLPVLVEKVEGVKRIFNNFRLVYQDRINGYQELRNELFQIENFNGTGVIVDDLPVTCQSLKGAVQSCAIINELALSISSKMQEFRDFYDWKCLLLALTDKQRELVNTVSEHLLSSWAESFEYWYLYFVIMFNEPPHLPKDDHEITEYKKLKTQFNNIQINNIVAQWVEKQDKSAWRLQMSGKMVNSLFNKKGSKGMKRNSLRSIIRHEFELFTNFFPVLLLNPSVCSSIIPLEEGIFDLVIFDEASQLRIEDTYAALIRGKAKVVSGDKHQMAPSSYFEGGVALLEPADEEEDEALEDEETQDRREMKAAQVNLADSESLLAYAENKGFKQSYLDIHYRSRHPYLIDFSNHAFYGKRLIPVPAEEDYTPIHFLQVNGVYEGQTNRAEVLRVMEILQHQIKPLPDGTYPSVGVATFNIYQRNIILDEVFKKRQEDASFDNLMSRLGDSFFVKNLENIQGDERDIIILSTTFGRKPDGSFSQTFGPIIQSKGHRMLNVIITRAKHQVYVCTSFPMEVTDQYGLLLQNKGNRGRGVLYAYLTYAKAVSDGNEELRMNILQTLSQHCSERHYDIIGPALGSESPFEDEVFERLAQHIGADRITQQYAIGGFRIDMVVHSRYTGKPLIAIECDGAKYHSSSEAYAWDIFRQEQLESYGFVFYRIWSTKWWDAADKEVEKLLGFIRGQDAEEGPVLR